MYDNNKKLLKQLTRTPRSVEPIGIIPRSILRTLQRFFRQVFMVSTDSVIAEFRISRYQLLISLQALSAARNYLTLFFLIKI